jgi:hypothetical protein
MTVDGSHRGLAAGSLDNLAADQALSPADNSVDAPEDGLPIDPPAALEADPVSDSHSDCSRSAAWTLSVAGSAAAACSASENWVVAAASAEAFVEPFAETVVELIAEPAVNSADGPDDSAAAEPEYVSRHFRSTAQRLSALPRPIQVGIDSSRVNLSLHLRLAQSLRGYYIWWSLSSSESAAESIGGGNCFNGSKFASES